jgi:hypothetical protein
MRRATWKFVDSSVIEAIWWNPDSKILHVRFLSGSYYLYYEVSKYRYYSFRHAESKGRYFNKFIKPNYRYRRVDG